MIKGLFALFDRFFNDELRFPQGHSFDSLTEQCRYFDHAKLHGKRMRSWTVWNAAWKASEAHRQEWAREYLSWHTHNGKRTVSEGFANWIEASFATRGIHAEPLDAWNAGYAHALAQPAPVAAPAPASEAVEVLRQLVEQIEKGSPVDDHGHPLVNNIAFIRAKGLL